MGLISQWEAMSQLACLVKTKKLKPERELQVLPTYEIYAKIVFTERNKRRTKLFWRNVSYLQKNEKMVSWTTTTPTTTNLQTIQMIIPKKLMAVIPIA